MSAPRRRILNVAKSDSLLNSRSAVLQGAGYEVVGAVDILGVKAACETHPSFDLVIIGYALPKEEKRRVMGVLRQFCGTTPIMELFSPGTAPVDEEADEQLATSGEADMLLREVAEVLAKPSNRRRAS